MKLCTRWDIDKPIWWIIKCGQTVRNSSVFCLLWPRLNTNLNLGIRSGISSKLRTRWYRNHSVSDPYHFWTSQLSQCAWAHHQSQPLSGTPAAYSHHHPDPPSDVSATSSMPGWDFFIYHESILLEFWLCFIKLRAITYWILNKKTTGTPAGWAFFNDHGPYLDFVKQYASQEEVHCASLRFQSTHRNN